MPNAGWPEQVGGRIMYPAGPEYFGEYALSFWEAGASLIGGCCGTTPQHIAAMRTRSQSAPADFQITEQGILPRQNESRSYPVTAAHPPGAKAGGGQVRHRRRDGPAARAFHPQTAGRRQPAGRSRRGCDQRGRQPDGAHAHEPLGGLQPDPAHASGIETVLHFPTRGRNLLRVQGDLLAAHALDVRNVFVVMGDPTAIGDYPDAMDNYDLVPSGLIKLIKQGFNAGVDHAGTDIGQPTSFFVGCALNLTPPDPEQEIKNLRRKLNAGADFILSQPIYDPPAAQCFSRAR